MNQYHYDKLPKYVSPKKVPVEHLSIVLQLLSSVLDFIIFMLSFYFHFHFLLFVGDGGGLLVSSLDSDRALAWVLGQDILL